MAGRDIITVAASAGGVEALMTLVGGLPADFSGTILIVLHVPASSPSALPQILSRVGPLEAAHAVNGESIHPGRIYIAPPNHHLLLDRGELRLTDGPRENRVRPSADPLFRSAARAYGRRVVGVVLSGADGDGTLGLEAIKLWGGIAIAQDPGEATFPSMPLSAIERVAVDHVAPVAQIPPLLLHLSRESLDEGGASMGPAGEASTEGADELPLTSEKVDGTASGLTCPDCHGSIWELSEGNLIRFECRVGHRYNPEAFLGAQASRVEDALWTAVNVLQERAAALRQFADRLSGIPRIAQDYLDRAEDTERQAEEIHSVLMRMIETADPEVDEPAERS